MTLLLKDPAATLDYAVDWVRYRVKLRSPARAIEQETDSPEATFSAGEVSALGDGALTINVVQVGDLAVSRPAELTLQFS
jgi:hypothetical protein